MGAGELKIISLVSTGYENPSALDGNVLDTVVDGKDFDTFATSALTLLATAATPQLTAAAAIAKFVSRAIPQLLVGNRDDQVGLYYL